jgi:hypothetical protein
MDQKKYPRIEAPPLNVEPDLDEISDSAVPASSECDTDDLAVTFRVRCAHRTDPDECGTRRITPSPELRSES